MKKIIKLLLLLVISLTVNSKDVCTSTCPINVMESKLKTAACIQPGIDENDWILNTRFKY